MVCYMIIHASNVDMETEKEEEEARPVQLIV